MNSQVQNAFTQTATEHDKTGFTTVDLTDAYFHVAIQSDHGQFLRFAFEGTA